MDSLATAILPLIVLLAFLIGVLVGIALAAHVALTVWMVKE